MNLESARQIIDTLAQGIHPVTGECMPEDSPYNAPPIIRALFAVSQALDLHEEPRKAAPPSYSGKPWDDEQDSRLIDGFDRGDELKTLAASLGRTRFAIEQRLVKLGKLSGGRFGAAPRVSG